MSYVDDVIRHRWRRTVSLLCLIALAFAGSGCDSNLVKFYFGDTFGKGSSSNIEKSAEQLAMEGMQELQKNDYEDAIKSFQQLKERYPYSKYAMLAELKLGDAYFFNKDYAEAAIAYEEFARLHPRNEVIPYVLYQIGMCHFLSFTTTDRDQEETRLAMEAFQRLIQAYPQSEYAQKARQQFFECQKRIVAHEYDVGRVYFVMKEYQAARDRLAYINDRYPEAVRELGYEKDVERMLAASKNQINQSQGAKKASIWKRMGL
jgi:outer membrane protein assembly factor BamD